MSHKETIVEAFQRYGYKLTLGQVLKYPWGYKFASRCADLRKEGYKIDCIKGNTPSENTYIMQLYEENGQARLL